MSKAKAAACGVAAVAAFYFAMPTDDDVRPISRTALDQLIESEGCVPCAYMDTVKVSTIGIGATRGLDGLRVKPNMVITDAEVAALLHRDIKDAAQCVTDRMNGWAMPQGVYDQMVNLVFNVGCDGVTYNHKRGRPTTIDTASLSGDWDTACNHILDFDRAGGKKSKALGKRRAKEYQRCHIAVVEMK